MDFKELLELLKNAERLLHQYDSGDLMTVLEIKDVYTELSQKLSRFPALVDLSRFCQLMSELSMRLSDIDAEEQAKAYLIRSTECLRSLFTKKITGQEAAKCLNMIISECKYLLEASEDDVEAESPQEEEAPEEPKSTKSYSEDYFGHVVKDKKMLNQLSDEIKEHLDSAQYTLLELEHDPTDQENINKVFRSFHTIKGSSAFLGLKNFEDVAHEMEELLVLIRDGKMRISKDLIDLIFFGIELLRNLVTIMDTYNFEVEPMVKSFLDVDIFSYIDLIIKILQQYQFKKIGEILEEEGKLTGQEVARILQQQKDSDGEKKFGTIAIEEKIVSNDDIKDAIKKQAGYGKRISYVKVSNERLNTLIDIVGELVINQSMLRQIMDTEDAQDMSSTERIISQLEGITTSIKNLVLSMGMVPIADVFNKLRVVIRNTATELQKAVIVNIKGEETELDRNVVEAIYDPLVHIVRNAVDHGLETPDEREKLKKDRVGKISIVAEHRGNGIEIIVEDDGYGIDKQKVLNKALSKGLIEQDQVESMSDRDIYALLFLPGFSTKKVATEVSGRGVGLDVVKKNIDEIHGKVDILSLQGKYSRFIIRLPLTLAIIEGFVFEIADNKYVFPFSSVDEIIVPDESQISVMDDGGRMLFNRGAYVPLIFSNFVLNEKHDENETSNKLAVIISHEDKHYGILVDRIIGKQEIVIKNLGESLQALSVFSGGTIFGDGTIGFVVDIEGFLEAAKKN